MDYKLSATLELNDKFSAKIKTAGGEMLKFQGHASRGSQKIRSFTSEVKGLFTGIKKGTKQSTGAVRETADCIKNSLGAMRNFAVAMGAVKAVSAGFNFVKSAFTEYADFNQVLTKNKAIMGANANEAAALKKQAMDLGKTMPFTAKEVAEAQKYQAMAGYKANDIIAMTPKLLKLSIASGEDLARTSDIMTDNLDAFGLKLSEADRLMDVMAATANNTNTSISMLGEAYTYVGAASRQFDSFEEVNIILGILANNGIKAGKAGRNLAAIYARLAKPTDDMNAEFAKTGTTLYDTNGKFKGLRKIIAESKPALDRMTEAQRNQWIATIAGTEGLKVWASIAGYSVEGTDKVTKAVYNSKGAVEEINKEMMNTPQNKIKALESAWEALKLEVADKAAPEITKIVEDMTEKVNDLASSDTFNKENIENFFASIREGVNGAIAVLEALNLALKPLVWLFKTTKAGGRAIADLGLSATVGLNLEDSEKKLEIDRKFERLQKIRPANEVEEEEKKRAWIENKKRETDFYNSLYKKKHQAGYIQKYLKNHNIDKELKFTDKDYEEMYYNFGGGRRRKEISNPRMIPGQNRIPQIPNIPVPQLQPQNIKKEVNVNLHVNLSGTVMKETVDNKKIADELSKYLLKEYKTQSLLQM